MIKMTEYPEIAPSHPESFPPFAYDVGLDDFEERVIQPSLEVPVLIDFWAPWCAPCQALKPLLEKLAAEYGGRFLLARINSDEYPQIAQHFGVRSIPTIKVIRNGRLAEEFSGARPEGEIRAFIDRLVSSSGNPLREQAAALVASGQLEEALPLLTEALENAPEDEAIRLDTADVLLELGHTADVQALMAYDFKQEADRARTLQARMALVENSVDAARLNELETRLAAQPDDHAARLELSSALAAAHKYREALEAALEVVQRDRSFNEGAGRKAMLQIFDALGGVERFDDLVREFRRRLSATLN